MSEIQIDFKKLWQHLSSQFLLGRDSIHGPAHWRRVETFGLKIAEKNGADTTVVKLFAVFHDSRRENESWDPEHGRRGAALAATLRGKFFDLDDARFAILEEACTFHADGFTHKHPTIGACWDADRLDLPRVGILPNPKLLCTAAARDKELLAWSLGHR